jgi:hypothetical protein
MSSETAPASSVPFLFRRLQFPWFGHGGGDSGSWFNLPGCAPGRSLNFQI